MLKKHIQAETAKMYLPTTGVIALVVCAAAAGFFAKLYYDARTSCRVSRDADSGETHSFQLTSESKGDNSQNNQVQTTEARIAQLGMASRTNAIPAPQPQKEEHLGNERHMEGRYFLPEVGGFVTFEKQRGQEKQEPAGLGQRDSGRVVFCPICRGAGRRDVSGMPLSPSTPPQRIVPCQNCRGTGVSQDGVIHTPY